MSETALERLIKKTRPFKNFTVDFEGEKEHFKVRRTSVLENEAISKCYNDTYDAALKRLQNESTTDYSLLHRDLLRQEPEDLADYLVEAMKEEITQDVLDLHDGEEIDTEDEKFQALVKEHQEAMKADLLKRPVEELTVMALDKREHFLALFEANRARMRMIAAMAIYDTEGNKFFPDDESVGSLDEAALEKIIRAASVALAGEAEADPLK